MDTQNLIWIDLELTGLDFGNDTIVEIATIITDKNLNIIAEGPDIVIHHSENVLANMDPWCIAHFGKSGLTKEIRKSSIGIVEAEQKTLDFIKQYVDKNISPMCGNSTQQDRRMLARHMPHLESYFHYRHIDVSTVKELALRWKPEITQNLKKEGKHRALSDVKESIEELKFYRKYFFK